MELVGKFGLKQLLTVFRGRITVTWSLVAFENIFLALIPLLIGYTIDGLLDGSFTRLLILAGVLAGLVVIMVVRRIYDTRAYGAIRVALGLEVDKRHRVEVVSTRNARLDMARELVDFLEEQVPEVLTAAVQLVVGLVILASFNSWLSFSALIMGTGMVLIYSLFHKRFYHLNANYNAQVEQQVSVLGNFGGNGLQTHLRALKNHEIRISDTEALVYGLIFLLATGFIIFNLYYCTTLPNMTTGTIFSIITYSWGLVDASLMLPIVLQSMTRLSEISTRLNNGGTKKAATAETDSSAGTASPAEAGSSAENETSHTVGEHTSGRHGVWLVGAVSLLAATLGWLSMASVEPEQAKPVAAALLPVTVAELSPDTRQLTVSSSGITAAHWPTAVVAAVSGRVASMDTALEPGTLINKGQVLAQLDSIGYLAEVDAAASRLAAAESSLARVLHEQSVALKTSGQRLHTPYARREPQVAAARQERKAAASALEDARRQLNDTRIMAPFNAIVLERKITPGQWLQPGEQAFTVAARDSVDVRVELPAMLWQRMGEVKTGVQAQVETPSGAVWPASIRYINPVRDQHTRQRSLVLKVDNPYGETISAYYLTSR